MKYVLISLVIVLLVGAVIFLFTSNNDTVINLGEGSVQQTFLPTKENVKLMGRSYFDGEKRHFSYSGSGVEFKFKGESATLNFVCDDFEKLLYGQRVRFAVLLNGETVYDVVMDERELSLEVKTKSSEVFSVVTVVKLSEAKYSSFALKNITVKSYGGISPTDENVLRIEFIGDSLTCGYGIDDTQSVFSTRTENFMKTYAYLAANELSADYSAICFSGYGVVSGFTSGARNPDAVVSRFYHSSCLMGDTLPSWNFNEKNNNLVVLNLGANDTSYCTNSYRVKEFYNAYVELIKTIRGCNPEAYILCVQADVNNFLFPTIEKAVSDYSTTTLDNRISTAMLDFKMEENDIVVDGHPGYLSNLSASKSLVKEIKELMLAGKISA